MYKNWYTTILIAICFLLFLLPQFWMGQSQYHLGGDDSRIYLYEPFEWFKNIGFWPKVTVNVFSSGMPQHMYLPFVLFASLIKGIFFFINLQTFFYGLSLSLAFLGVYLSIRELLETDDKASYIASVIGGLTYIFLPLSYITFFMNPVKYVFIIFLYPFLLFFYLKAVHKTDIRYLLLGAALTSLFSISFSEIPYLYAFIIGSAIFLVSYSMVYRKVWLLIRYILLYGGLIILFNFFWIFSFFASPFYGDNVVSSAVNGKIRIENLESIKAGVINHNIIDSFLGLNSRFLYGKVDFLKLIYQYSFINVLFPIIIFSGLFLSKLQEKKKRLYLACLIPFIVLIFLQTVNIGSWGPDVFSYLVKTIPGFVSLRNFDFKVAPTYMLFLSLVLGISLYQLYISYQKKKQFILISSLLVGVVILFNAMPLIGGRVLSFSLSQEKQIDREIKIPDSYISFLKNIVPTWPESRVVTLPFTNGSWSIFLDERAAAYIGHPLTQIIGGRDSIGGRVSFMDPNLPELGPVVQRAFLYEDYDLLNSLFGFINISNVVYHPSVFSKGSRDFWENQLWEYRKGFTKNKYQNFIKNLEKYKQFSENTHEVYHIPNKFFIPRLTVSNSAIEVDDMNPLLADIAFVRGLNETAVVSERKRFSSESPLSELTSYKVAQSSCIACLPDQPKSMSLPYVRFLPESPLYPIIQWKEQRSQKNALQTGDIKVIVDLELELAGKRLKEFSLLMNRRADKKMCILVLQQFDKHIEASLALIEKANIGLQAKNDLLIHLDEKLSFYIEQITLYYSDIEKTDTFGKLLQRELNNLQAKRVKIKDKIWKSDEKAVRYLLSVPVSGEYDIYLKEYGENISDLTLTIGNEVFFPKPENVDKKNMLYLGKYDFNVGESKLSVSRKINENLIEEESRDFIINNGSEKNIVYKQYNWKKIYSVSFDYQLSSNSDALFQVLQNNDELNQYNVPVQNMTQSLKQSLVQEHVEFQFIPNVDSQVTTFQFSLKTKDRSNTLKITNLAVREEISPKIIVVKKNEKFKQQSLPVITFQKINPIRYEVHVENAHNPYLLVLADAYHKGWKVTIDDKEHAYQLPVYSYLGGKVGELLAKNILFDFQFLTLGKEIAVDKHMSVNGYANAWYITPEDLQNKKDYRLMVTFWPQNIFYIALLLSVIGISILVIYILKFYKK